MVIKNIEKTKKDITKGIKNQVATRSSIFTTPSNPQIPYVVQRLPPFLHSFHGYILQKAREDLPTSHFSKKEELTGLGDLVTIGGVLGYTGDVVEIKYMDTNYEKISLENTPQGTFSRPGLLDDPFIDFSSLENVAMVVDWHTHPIPSYLGDADFNHMLKFSKNLSEHFPNKPVLFAVYLPVLDQMHWLSMKSTKHKLGTYELKLP